MNFGEEEEEEEEVDDERDFWNEVIVLAPAGHVRGRLLGVKLQFSSYTECSRGNISFQQPGGGVDDNFPPSSMTVHPPVLLENQKDKLEWFHRQGKAFARDLRPFKATLQLDWVNGSKENN